MLIFGVVIDDERLCHSIHDCASVKRTIATVSYNEFPALIQQSYKLSYSARKKRRYIALNEIYTCTSVLLGFVPSPNPG